MITIKKWYALFCLALGLTCWISPSYADNFLGQSQTIQINTRFHSVVDKPLPVWSLILRDADTGVVMPYMYDIKNNDNFWIAFSFGRNYIITVSNLKFGPFAVIHNFCHLENTMLSGQSMILTLTGDLTPSPRTIKCHILKYKN